MPPRYGIHAIAAILALSCGDGTGGPSSDVTLGELAGSWRYVSWRLTTPAGERNGITDENGAGAITFTADGRFRIEEFQGSSEYASADQSLRTVLEGQARIEGGVLYIPSDVDPRRYTLSETSSPDELVLTRLDSIRDPNLTYWAAGLKHEVITIRRTPAVAGLIGRIVFTRAEGPFHARTDVYVMNADGTNLVRLTNDGAIDQDPVWSPDGQRIAFASSREGPYTIWVMNADGTDQVRIDPGNPGMHPSWSADGTKIVFERLGGLFYAFADGSPGWVQLGPTMPAGPPFPGWHYPDWSPTGNRIVLSESSNGFVLRLSTIAPDGTGVTALTPPPVERDLAPLNARWSPDGQRVAYTAVGPRWFVAVAVQALAGGDPQELTEFPRSGRAPAWSPSGHAIVFQSHGDLYVTTLDGGILNLTASPDFREFTPDWAP